MDLLKLIFRNSLRHPLRSGLTVLGITVALLSFCLIRTLINAFYTGVEMSAADRLITRSAVSLIFPLPLSYFGSIKNVPGIQRLSYGSWFGGTYKDEPFGFPQFALEETYLDIYPEWLISAEDRKTWMADRQGALVGQDLADRYHFKPGDVVQIQGTIYPGLWEFKVSGVFKGREPRVDTNVLLFHWEYLNERNRLEIDRSPDHVGWFMVQLAPGVNPASVGQAIDARFANSYAETMTETESAFISGFISMSSSIITALQVISYVVIVIMFMVMANTMLMSARERYREYAIIQALGFEARHIAALILGEAGLMGLAGFALLSAILTLIFSIPQKVLLGDLLKFFPNFVLNPWDLGVSLAAAMIVAALSSIAPIIRITGRSTADNLRH